MKKTVLSTLLILAVCLQSTSAITPSEIAQRSGITRGLVVLPETTDASLAAGLAKAGYLVYALCPTDAVYQTLSKTFLSSGMLNQRIYLDVGTAADAPIQRLADIVVVDTLPADTTPLMKMLAPRRGVLLTADGQSIVCPAPEGGDQWRHRLHAPDNRRVSADRLIKPDLVSEWYGLPLKEGFWGTTVVSAGGRVYTLVASRNAGDQVDLIARSLHDGCELWRRSQPDNSYGGRSIMAAGDHELWLADGADLRVLDGESGKELRTVPGPQPDGQIKWIALFTNAVAVLSGAPDDYRKLQYQAFVNNPEGSHLAVYRLDGKKIWQKDLPGAVDEREIAAMDGTLFFHVQGAGTMACAVADGSVLWNNPATAELIDPSMGGKAGDLNSLLVSDRSLMVDPSALIFAAAWKASLVSLDPATGEILWHKSLGKTKRSLAAVLKDGVWYGTEFLNARTGEPTGQSGKIPQSICSVTACVGNWFMTAFGDLYTIDGLKQERYADQRTPCDMGNVVVDGTLFGDALQCTCATDIHGFRVAGVMDLPLHQAGPAAERLTVFSTTAPEPLNLTSDDWPTDRHAPDRSGSTPVAIGKKPMERWSLPADEPADKPVGFLSRSLPSGAVHGAGKTWYVNSLGVLHCIDTETGKPVWQQILGARSFAPPTVDQGLVFVGDINGIVHAFSAIDGTPQWRFEAAPYRQKMLWYGQLASLWPCTGGVVAFNHELYVVAGYQESNGIHAYKLDPATGRVLWESHDAGTGGERGVEAAFGNYGHLAVGAGRLWLSSSTFYPGSYSLEDGSWRTAPSMMDHHFYGVTMRRGADISVLNDTFVIVGGMRLSTQQELPEQVIKGDGYNALSVTPPEVPETWNGKAFYGVDMINRAVTAPAWDDDLMVAGVEKYEPRAWKTAAVSQQIQAAFDRGVDPADRDQFQQRSLGTTNSKQTASAPTNPVWADPSLQAVEMVLCANTALAIVVEFETINKVKLPKKWFLCALNRTDGAEEWRIELPTKPLHGGLSVASGGKIAIVFDDGSVRGYW